MSTAGCMYPTKFLKGLKQGEDLFHAGDVNCGIYAAESCSKQQGLCISANQSSSGCEMSTAVFRQLDLFPRRDVNCGIHVSDQQLSIQGVHLYQSCSMYRGDVNCGKHTSNRVTLKLDPALHHQSDFFYILDDLLHRGDVNCGIHVSDQSVPELQDLHQSSWGYGGDVNCGMHTLDGLVHELYLPNHTDSISGI
ncbi:uncharacterized protein BO80DRAFT_439344 [Aspergillus ibericus CBS 121593]|uniref:Uncharacterized protein n=1 Tax=Aspergillus ibericus CBS 121593 TaxID=1448316 RepID=A0A395GL07_9EURO|nr:hypothetical protein BO80DRAFT_439344 [Aspergillus ibericus CBS 121593]RAK95497.1 hypothetical protein BO80DRAFT_439344 [Aspergillus ibericus CBS 121593]